MLDRIQYILQHKCFTNTSQTLLIGVSGGPDSLCLADILYQLKIPLIVAHVNHQLREAATYEALIVKEWAQQCRLTFELGVCNVHQFAQNNKLSIEEAARIQRYQFLFSKAQQHSAKAVVVAHTADDQVETVLMHFLRGAGLAGLRGMPYLALPNPWSQTIPLLRPLLSTWREEVLSYCTQHHLQPVADQSNYDTTYYRNRLRQELIPFLHTYNPQIKQVIWRTSQLAAEDYQLLESQASQTWEECLVEKGDGIVGLRLSQIKQTPIALQRAVIRKVITQLHKSLRDVDFRTIEQVLEFIVQPTRSKNIQLSNQMRGFLEQDVLWLMVGMDELPVLEFIQTPTDPVDVPVPGLVELTGGWRLETKFKAFDHVESTKVYRNTDPYQAWFDADLIKEKMVIRRRFPGDRYSPLGMNQHSIKISDLMVNAKIPLRARQSWPIICLGKEIVWVPGFPPSQAFCVSGSTRRLLHLLLFRQVG